MITLNKKNNGFTLIELMLVVVLIGVLSGVMLSVINISGMKARSRDAQRAGDLKRIQTALELYFSDNRGYPSSGSFVEIKGGMAPLTAELVTKGYIQTLPPDPMSATAVSACGLSSYGYYYETNSAGPALSGKYVIMTVMESASSANSSLCNAASNCTGGGTAGCSYGSPCYCVQNPL